MSNKRPEARLEGRSAKTGKFTSIAKAKAFPSTHVVERVPLPGKGRK